MGIVSFLMSIIIFLSPVLSQASKGELDSRMDYLDILLELNKDGVSEEIGYPDLTRGLFDLEFVDLDGDGSLELVSLNVENSLYDGFYLRVYNSRGEIYREEISGGTSYERAYGILEYKGRNYVYKEEEIGTRRDLILYDFSSKKLRNKKKLTADRSNNIYEYENMELGYKDYLDIYNEMRSGIKKKFILLASGDRTELKYLEDKRISERGFVELYRDIVKTYLDENYRSVKNKLKLEDEEDLLAYIGQANFYGKLSTEDPDKEEFLDYLSYSYSKDWNLDTRNSSNTIFIQGKEGRYMELPASYVREKLARNFIGHMDLGLEEIDGSYHIDMPDRDYSYILNQLDDIYRLDKDIYLILLENYRIGSLDILSSNFQEALRANGLIDYSYPKNLVELFKKPRSSWKGNLELDENLINPSMLLIKRTEDGYRALEYKDSSYIDRDTIKKYLEDYGSKDYASQLKEEKPLKKSYKELILVVVTAFILLVIRIIYKERADKKS